MRWTAPMTSDAYPGMDERPVMVGMFGLAAVGVVGVVVMTGRGADALWEMALSCLSGIAVVIGLFQGCVALYFHRKAKRDQGQWYTMQHLRLQNLMDLDKKAEADLVAEEDAWARKRWPN
jgi:hypothetical protein